MIVRDEEVRHRLRSVQVDGGVTGSTDANGHRQPGQVERITSQRLPLQPAPGLEFLNGDWVLVLDADEQLRPEPSRC